MDLSGIPNNHEGFKSSFLTWSKFLGALEAADDVMQFAKIKAAHWTEFGHA